MYFLQAITYSISMTVAAVGLQLYREYDTGIQTVIV